MAIKNSVCRLAANASAASRGRPLLGAFQRWVWHGPRIRATLWGRGPDMDREGERERERESDRARERERERESDRESNRCGKEAKLS